MNPRDFDLICMGRCAVDLYSEQIYASIENTHTFAKYVGGCPANIAVGSARLGLKAAILSRVGNEAMGHFVRDTLESENVDITYLKTDDERLTGLVFLGINPPDKFPLLFYRENCADMAIDTSDFNKELFVRSKSLLITGTHCSTEHTYRVTKAALSLAFEAGSKIIFDIDYRPVLWNATARGNGEQRYVKNALFQERLSSIFSFCDLIVGTEEEIFAATGVENIDEAVWVIRKYSNAIIVQKRGALGCVVYHPNQKNPVIGEPFPVHVLNVLGAGDAFLSGFLKGYLNEWPLEKCCELGNANGALVVTRHGCSVAMPYLEELNYFIDHRDDITEVNHLHRILGRRNTNQLTCFLAFDHRIHFVKIAEKYHATEKAIEEFKMIIFNALDEYNLAEFPSLEFGVIVDDQYGTEVIRKIDSDKMKIAKPIEFANSYPLHFLDKREASDILHFWPKHMLVKVLVYVKPDLIEIDHFQLNTLKKLSNAANISGHQLMIELVYFGKSDNLNSIVHMIEHCYKAKIHPTWWKLPPICDEDSWKNLTNIINQYDPKNCGILLLGSHIPIDELSNQFSVISSICPKIRGYAVGRSVWDQAAQLWFERVIDDHKAKKMIQDHLKQLLEQCKQRDHDDSDRIIQATIPRN